MAKNNNDQQYNPSGYYPENPAPAPEPIQQVVEAHSAQQAKQREQQQAASKQKKQNNAVAQQYQAAEKAVGVNVTGQGAQYGTASSAFGQYMNAQGSVVNGVFPLVSTQYRTQLNKTVTGTVNSNQLNGVLAGLGNAWNAIMAPGHKYTVAQVVGNLMNLAQSNASQFNVIQQALAYAGYLDVGKAALGQFTGYDANAIAQLLTTNPGMLTGTGNLAQIFQQAFQSRQGQTSKQVYDALTGQGSLVKPFTQSTVSSAADLQGTLASTQQSLTGEGISPSDYANFVTQAQAYQRANPTHGTITEELLPGGELASRPYPIQTSTSTVGGVNQQGLDQFATAYAMQNNGNQIAHTGFNKLIQMFMGMLGPGGGAFSGGTQSGQA